MKRKPEDAAVRVVWQLAFRREAAMYEASGRTIHLWRAFFWARRLGAELPPWMVEYLDRVAERLHRLAPTDSKDVADIFELGAANRHLQYGHERDDLAGQVMCWREQHPTIRAQAFAKVAEANGLSEAEVRHAYYFFQKKSKKTRK
jgi:hypothetical protein